MDKELDKCSKGSGCRKAVLIETKVVGMEYVCERGIMDERAT